MADREIRLIGSFQDDISPKLNKLNRQLLGTIKQFEKLQNKIAPVAAEMAKFNTAAAATSGNLKSQRSAIEENIRMLRQYRTELSRTANAQSRMGRGGMPRPPRGGGGGGGSPIPPRAAGGGTPRRGGGGRGGGGYDGGGIGAGVFGVTLGTQLGNMMTSAIIAGFQTGTQIMMAPFKFGAQAIGERIRDEMSDVRTAGGLFAISKRMEKPIFGNFAEAENYTKEQNRYLAQLAGSLPGDTQEYIQVSKQIADGIFMVVSQDAKNAQKFAQTLAATRGASAAEIAKLSGSGTTAMQATGKELVGEMTKLTVLAGLGGRQGAFGLPQLTERMISEQQISMGMFQRYAAIFRDPMIKGALERNIKNINATGKNTSARLEALQKTFQEIVTPELVRRYQRTTAGVLEALKTAFLNPEVGLLGLGRPLGAAVTRFDEFGRAMGEVGGKMVPLVNTFEKNGKLYGYTLDKQGKATRQLVEAATEQISIFDSLRDVFANVMIVLQPIIDNIALIFDPLANLGGVLAGFRDATMKFQSAFERYREFLVGAAKGIADEKSRLQFTATIPLRASLQTINDALRAYGGYAGDAMAEFNRVSALLANPATGMEEMGRILKGMIEKFLSSEFAAKIGSGIGTVVGTVLSEVANMMKAAAGLATGGKLAEGFSAGFTAAGGPQAFADIIKSVFHIFGKLLLEIVKAAPLEAAIVAALLFLPGAIAGLVSQALSGGIAAALGGKAAGGGLLAGAKARGGAALAGAKNFLKGPAGAVQGVGAMGKGTGLGRIPAMASGIPKNFMAGLKAIGPKLLGLGGIISGVIALLEGKSILEAIAAGLGSAGGAAIGAAIGTVIFPGVGTAIGAALGGWIGTMDGVTIPLRDAFQAIIDTVGPIVTGVVDAFGSLLFTIFSIVNAFNPFASRIGAATEGISGLHATIIAFKVVLTPVVAAFQLFEQIINTLVLAFRGLELAVLVARLGLSKINPFADPAAQARLEREVAAASTRAIEAQGRFGASFERHKGYYQTPAPGTKPTTPAPAYRGGQRGGGGGGAVPAANIPAAVPPPAANPVPAIQALNVKQAGANALLAQLKTQVVTSADGVKRQIGASSNAQQAKIQGVTTAINNLSAKFTAGLPVRVINTPTVKFDMGGMGPVGGGIGGFPKTSGYGMRGGKMHQGNDSGAFSATIPYWGGNFNTPLGKAISSEMRNKPTSSDLVIANSSETIIPQSYTKDVAGLFGLFGGPAKPKSPLRYGDGAAPSGKPKGWAADEDGAKILELLGGTRVRGAADGMIGGYMRSSPIPTMAASAGDSGARNITTGPITISVDGYNQDPKQLTETIAAELIGALYRKSRSEVLTS